MTTIKQYLKNLASSIYSTEHYIKAINKPLGSSFLFFIISIIIISVFRGANTALIELPKIKNNSYAILDEVNNNFDKDLEIIWSDNQLELNRDHLNIYWPSSFNHDQYELPNIFAVISNSETSADKSNLPNVSSSVLYINRNNIYAIKKLDAKEWNEFPLSELMSEPGSYSINKQNLPKIISNIKEKINQSFIKIQILTVIISGIVFIFSRIWFLIIESVLVYFIFKIYSLNLTFKNILKLDLNILVPVEIIHLFSNTFYSDLNIPMDSISFWIILSFISFHLRKTKIKDLKKH